MEDNFSEFDDISPFGPSNQSGVYGVFITTTIKTRCVYIGSSKNIQKRVTREDHIYRILYDRLNKYDVSIYTRQISCIDFINKERELIRKYKPLLNKIRYGS